MSNLDNFDNVVCTMVYKETKVEIEGEFRDNSAPVVVETRVKVETTIKHSCGTKQLSTLGKNILHS